MAFSLVDDESEYNADIAVVIALIDAQPKIEDPQSTLCEGESEPEAETSGVLCPRIQERAVPLETARPFLRSVCRAVGFSALLVTVTAVVELGRHSPETARTPAPDALAERHSPQTPLTSSPIEVEGDSNSVVPKDGGASSAVHDSPVSIPKRVLQEDHVALPQEDRTVRAESGSVVEGPVLEVERESPPTAVSTMASGTANPSADPPRLDTPSMSIPQRPNTRRVPQQVERVFRNRAVYCTVMPGPSSLPDWMVWFGEAELPQHGSRLVMRPPTAQSTSVSPGLIKGAVESKLWVSARLGKDGRLTSVSVAQGASAPRAVDLATEMENWRFTPAIRNGEAVEVDLLLEANFVRQSGSDDRN